MEGSANGQGGKELWFRLPALLKLLAMLPLLMLFNSPARPTRDPRSADILQQVTCMRQHSCKKHSVWLPWRQEPFTVAGHSCGQSKVALGGFADLSSWLKCDLNISAMGRYCGWLNPHRPAALSMH